MENPIKIDDLGVPFFLETPISLFKVTFEDDDFPVPQVGYVIVPRRVSKFLSVFRVPYYQNTL